MCARSSGVTRRAGASPQLSRTAPSRSSRPHSSSTTRLRYGRPLRFPSELSGAVLRWAQGVHWQGRQNSHVSARREHEAPQHVCAASRLAGTCTCPLAQRLTLQSVPEEEFLKAIKQLLIVDKDWIPRERGYSLYIRPTMIATTVHHTPCGLFILLATHTVLATAWSEPAQRCTTLRDPVTGWPILPHWLQARFTPRGQVARASLARWRGWV